ncbi:MAG: ABC transporter ATP-binding protein [Thermaerobacter sp.]|nr:ABC transporter ATP-binding protein [Thermaerobacter sp.]
MLTVNHLRKRFGPRPALDDLSFTVHDGYILGLVGPNGAGKTTTLSCLAALLPPDGGTMLWNGRALMEQSGVTGLLPESPEVYPLLTVWEHLAFTARLFDLGPNWAESATVWLERMGLASQRDTLGAVLSKGLRQRVLLACAGLRRAQLMLVDEPMIGLDPQGQKDVRELLSLFRREGSAVVLSSHQLPLVEQVADYVLILNKGREVAEGTVADLKSRLAGSATLEDVFLSMTQDS